MNPHYLEWLTLLIRWIHITAGVAWIGASFYFNWLEGNLDRKPPKPERIAGDIWSVHGGGFYHAQKYEVAPERLPETLHWFKWEAYTTWISGFALLLVVFYLNPGAWLLGENPLQLSNAWAITLGLASMGGAWLLYDLLCRTPLVTRALPFALTGFLLTTVIAYGLTLAFDGRAAFIHVGAMIGTIMAANVFFVIIPAQRKMVDAMGRGEAPDPTPGKQALQRSLHNNYMTLPVLFIMMSGHFPSTFGQQWNWAILAGLSIISACARHYFNLKNKGRKIVWILPVALAAFALLAVISQPQPVALSSSTDHGEARFWQVRQIIDQRCLGCHSAQPDDPAFQAAAAGLMLDTPEQIQRASDLIYSRAVLTQSMPLGNLSGMTQAERDLLGAWINAGAELR
jgi:uncharacterized membrane protein